MLVVQFFQVTRLSCGGFIVGLRFIHAICDAIGLVQFLNAVGEMARGARVPFLLPVWARETTLVALRPPRVTCPHHEFDELEEDTDSPPSDPSHDEEEVQSSVFFGPKEIRSLRARLPPRLISSSPTTFEIITACLLRCRTVALQLHPDAAVRIGCTISVRRALRSRLPDGYYGNAFVYPVAQASEAGRVGEPSLGHALELVKQVKAQVNDEYVRSLADFLVINGRRKYNGKSLYIVSDNRRLGFEDIDLGWGKPIYGGEAAAVGVISFLVNYKNGRGEDGTVASIALPKEAMKRFHHELKAMTQEESIHI